MNKDIRTRDEVLFGEYDKEQYLGGTRRFSGVTLEDLQFLFEHDFIDPFDAQNYSPTAQEYYDFLQKYPAFSVHGYAVSDDRDDYRVTIEGVNHAGKMTEEEMVAFVELFRFADEFDFQTGYCWYD